MWSRAIRVEVEQDGSPLLGTTVADLHDISYDTGQDEVYGFAPTGETVRVSFRDVSGGSDTYVETHAVASAGEFTADFTDADLRPSSAVGLYIPDANGNETALVSGPPFIEAVLDRAARWIASWGGWMPRRADYYHPTDRYRHLHPRPRYLSGFGRR